MSYEVTEGRYRFATIRDQMPPGRVVTVINTPGVATVVVRPGHATEALIADLQKQHRGMLLLGRWVRLAHGDEPEPEDKRAVDARWELIPGHLLPSSMMCLPMERVGHHLCLIREGEATRKLVADMNELLTDLVRKGVWLQRWDEPAARHALLRA